VFAGPEILPLDIYDAVAHFNIGCQASVKIFEELGISPGHYCKMRLNELINQLQRTRNQQVSVEITLRQKKRTDKHEKEGDTYLPSGL
ncbi:hypothetical protein pdam_00022389, partial [Pocillopora damicornis]